MGIIKTLNKYNVYKILSGFSTIFISVIITFSLLFWYQFLLYLFLKEFFPTSSYELHNQILAFTSSNPGLIMLFVMSPCWILILWFLKIKRRDLYG